MAYLNKMQKLSELRKVMRKHLHPVVLMMVPMVFFGKTSFDLLVAEEPEWFARLGSLMVVWAILNYTVQKEAYSKSSVLWDQVRVFEHLNQMRKLDELRQDSLNLTFDIHATQIAQLALLHDMPQPFVENNKESIKTFCDDVSDRMAKSTVYTDSTDLIEKLEAFEDDYKSVFVEHSQWSSVFTLLEILLLIWGTVQWGYGDCFVIWVRGMNQSCS